MLIKLLLFALLGLTFATEIQYKRDSYVLTLDEGFSAFSDDYFTQSLDNLGCAYVEYPYIGMVIADCPPGEGLGIASTPEDVRMRLNGLPRVQEVGSVPMYPIPAPEFDGSVEFRDMKSQSSVQGTCGNLPFPTGKSMPNLDRSDQCNLPLNGLASNCPTGQDYSDLGAGATVVVIDTGCIVGHVESTGRWKCSQSTPTCADKNGHGTHVSGTATGNTVGLARAANVLCVNTDAGQFLDGAKILAGFNEAGALKAANPNKAVIASCSFGGSGGQPDAAVQRISRLGVVVVVAAGNSNADACGFNPASTPEAITVGALNPDGATKASFSNFGKCVDVSAIGVNVYSSWFTATNSYASLSGTSMSTPLVSGMAALILTKPGYTPSTNDPAVVLAALTACGTQADDARLQTVASLATKNAPPPGAPVVTVSPAGANSGTRPSYVITVADTSAKYAYAYLYPQNVFVLLTCTTGRCSGQATQDITAPSFWTATVLSNGAYSNYPAYASYSP